MKPCAKFTRSGSFAGVSSLALVCFSSRRLVIWCVIWIPIEKSRFQGTTKLLEFSIHWTLLYLPRTRMRIRFLIDCKIKNTEVCGGILEKFWDKISIRSKKSTPIRPWGKIQIRLISFWCTQKLLVSSSPFTTESCKKWYSFSHFSNRQGRRFLMALTKSSENSSSIGWSQ